MTAYISRRTYQHVHGIGTGFSKKNHTNILVHIEPHPDFVSADHRETCIKRWKREWKIRLIESQKPTWMDLSRKVGVSR